MRASLYLVLASLAAGCSLEADVPPAPEARNLTERLADGEHLFVDPALTTIEITGRYTGNGGSVGTAIIPLVEGSLDVRVDEQNNLVVDALEAKLADVLAQPTEYPLHLTHIELTLAEPVTAATCWTGDLASASIDTEMTLLLDWALQTPEGVVAPLGTEELGPLLVTVETTVVDGHVVAHLDVHHDGVLWDWAGILQLEDLRIDLEAADVPRGPVP
jgi:hypothetical protein